MKFPQDTVVKPGISEKSYRLVEENKYTFEVDPRASKGEIKRAIEALFKVSVRKVNTLSVKGKWRRQGRTEGKTRNWKKAVVTLKEGNKIELFETK